MTTTKRSDEIIMMEFRAAYSMLANGGFGRFDPMVPEEKRQTRVQSLRAWVLRLAEEFGRMVPEEEAYMSLKVDY